MLFWNGFLGDMRQEQGTCSSESNCGPPSEIDGNPNKEKEYSSGLALQPIQSDLLSLKIRPAGGPDYNIHELPTIDGKVFNLRP